MPKIYALVLAGGSGTRFWPASRRLRPKQLLDLGLGSGGSLIEATVRRLEALCAPNQICIATGKHLVESTRAHLPQLPEESFFAEPCPRNTAPCIAWGTALIHRRHPGALVMVVPSDAHVADEPAFRVVLERALASAESGPITTIGLQPTRPETGYGYVEAGEEVAPGVRRVVRFVEKPDRPRAEAYVASGRHFWNSGMFFFTTDVMLSAVREHMPQLAEGLERIEAAAREGVAAEARVTEEVFPQLPEISIDYGVMEHVAELNVVPASFGWSDVGSWQAAYELAARDAAGNAAAPATVCVDAQRNLVVDLRRAAGERTIALLGVSDLCVVETDDALLVMPRERSQDVRLVIEELQRRGSTRVL